MTSEKIEKKLALLPMNPGVYLMKNSVGTVIYVGKSRCLKKRVNSYFNRHHDSNKTNALVAAIDDFEYIITNTEVEALILENNLIKKHNPHYNILLKDNKTYPYIKVTMKDRFPRLEKVRKVAYRDGNLYYGPFPSGYDLSRIIDMLSRTFRLCTSKKAVGNDGKKKRPCLNYHLGLCQGVCQGNISPEEYAVSVNKTVDVLSGKVPPDFTGLEKQLKELSAKFLFEEAAELRDTLTALRKFFESQKVEFLKPIDIDFWGIAEAGLRVIFSVFSIRGGKLLGNRIIDFERYDDMSLAEALTEVINRHYDIDLIPAFLYSSLMPDGDDSLLEMLSAKADRKVSFHVPQKGQFLTLLEMANNNAREFLRNSETQGKERIDDSVIDLQTRLGLKKPPIHIECTDIAHIQGVDPVASVVVCENGKPKKSEYRLFHIKEAMGGDDPASIGEIVRRRFSRLLAEQRPLPDLFIVDGGITQLHSAMHELELLGIHDQQIMGLAKKEELLVQTDGREIKLPFSSPGMRVIIKLRNEAHRFCHTFQSKTHTQRTLRSSLLNLPGVGPVILKKLILEFGSIEKVVKATAEEIVERCHIPLKTAELIINSV
ncbi:MAG: excinuclease ABC subunit UvrC [Candidatus Riflebacteria bacterium]|nr:excinuclease ABC subunit UvrC [Candidatus Riflebacteria bacterium]